MYTLYFPVRIIYIRSSQPQTFLPNINTDKKLQKYVLSRNVKEKFTEKKVMKKAPKKDGSNFEKNGFKPLILNKRII